MPFFLLHWWIPPHSTLRWCLVWLGQSAVGQYRIPVETSAPLLDHYGLVPPGIALLRPPLPLMANCVPNLPLKCTPLARRARVLEPQACVRAAAPLSKGGTQCTRTPGWRHARSDPCASSSTVKSLRPAQIQCIAQPPNVTPSHLNSNSARDSRPGIIPSIGPWFPRHLSCISRGSGWRGQSISSWLPSRWGRTLRSCAHAWRAGPAHNARSPSVRPASGADCKRGFLHAPRPS